MAKSSKAVAPATRLEAITYVIALDSKSRLVLPLEIRDFLGIAKSQKLLFRCRKQEGTLLLELEKAQENTGLESVLCSKNCAYLQSGENL